MMRRDAEEKRRGSREKVSQRNVRDTGEGETRSRDWRRAMCLKDKLRENEEEQLEQRE